MRRLLIYSSVIWSAVTMSSCLTALTLLGAFDSASSSSSYAKGDFRYSYCINDFWVNWRDEKLSNVGIKGGYDEMWFVRADKPWEVYCHFKINSFYRHEKTTNWTEYSGYIEYYVNESYPTISDSFKYVSNFQYYQPFPFYVTSEKSELYGHCVKRTANATIKIASYKNSSPRTYNIFFDGVAFGFNLCDLKFK